jgi:hypothetical protein
MTPNYITVNSNPIQTSILLIFQITHRYLSAVADSLYIMQKSLLAKPADEKVLTIIVCHG